MTDTGYSGPAEYWDEVEREAAVRDVVPATSPTDAHVGSSRRHDVIAKTVLNVVAFVILAAFLGAALWYGK